MVIINAPKESRLTPRQLEIIGYLAEGKSIGQIALLIGIRYDVVRQMLTDARGRCGGVTLYQLLFMAGTWSRMGG